ncbi:uncharacterized protein LOC110987443 [Acanthaster planci]|uniref:Uncharacterized protein LOC110987443 n=1 Tax=Acanthaster planci TaxID=133434 RepID=A0A8B7ZK28_ACAPL|nr:uncharacterized protein LOC110987443 [Acanthaster planci]
MLESQFTEKWILKCGCAHPSSEKRLPCPKLTTPSAPSVQEMSPLCGTCQGASSIDDIGHTLAKLTVTPGTVAPRSMTPHTVLPPEKSPGTVVPPVKTDATAPTVNPTAGLLCGDYETADYDLRQLTGEQYWNLNVPGGCFDYYDQPNVMCQFHFAFCKQIPPGIVGAKTGIGAAQVTNIAGSGPIILGGLSQIEQNEDDKGTQLLIRFRHGENKKCGGEDKNLQVEMHLHCDPNTHWLSAHNGSAPNMPSTTIVSLDKQLCKYTVTTMYDGACFTYQGLSAGTIVIIIFFSLVCVYLIGGAIFNKMGGAKGLEIIPNYDMWRMFPSDVMGGVVFVWGIITCRGMGSKAKAYDDL